jgi:uncharacterized protein (DUF58 family)
MIDAMTSLTAGTIARAYLVVVLELSVLVSSLLQLGLALALLAVQLYSAYKPPKASLNLVLVVSSLVFAPLALEALAGVYAVLLIVPALFLLDRSLKDFALTQAFSFSRVGRSASFVLKFLGLGLLLVFGVSDIVWNVTLMLTTVVLMGYLVVLVVYVFRAVPKMSLTEEKTWRRILVGDLETVEFNIKGKADTPILVSLKSADSWIHIEPTNFMLPAKKETKASVRFTPPLAGPSTIQVQAAYVDSRGLVQTGQVLEPVDLHIIPRAKYAQWLANKFLAETSIGGGLAIAVEQSSSRAAKYGVEFHDSRPYQAGDRLRDIDWRHSYMLGELIVKEFSGSQGQVGLIAADLTAKDAQDADRLAYNFVMSVLTLATEALASALAVYNRNEVLAVTQPINPRETLKKALELTEKIIIVESKEKVLQPTEMRRLKRSIGQLEEVKSDSARRLGKLLEFEFDANEESARLHPATLALAKAVENIKGPAVITVVSSMSDDSDALSLSLERLKEKGYRIVEVGSAQKKQ